MDSELVRLLDLMEEGAIVIRHGILEFVNRRVVTMLHLQAADVLGRPLSVVLPPRLWAQLEPALLRAGSSKGRPATSDISWEDATYGEVHLKFHIVVKDDTTLIQVSRSAPHKPTDLDARLAELRERLAAMLGFIASSGIGVAFFERDEAGRPMTRSANDHFCAILGRREEDLVGMDPCDLVHPDDQPRVREHIGQMWEGGLGEQLIDLNFVDASGELVHTQVSTTMLSEPAGNVAVCFVQDVSVIDMALEEHRKFAFAIEHVEETVVLADGMGRISYANPAALLNSGYTLEEVIGKPLSIFHAPETVGPVAGQALKEFMARGYWRGDILACTKDGVRYPVEVIGSLVKDEKGRPSMIIVVSRRIDERQRYEAELLLARRHMEYIVTVLGEDLKTTISRSLPMIEHLLADDGMHQEVRTEMEAFAKTLSSLGITAERVMRTEVDITSARRLRPIDLPSALRERVAEASRRWMAKGVQVELDLPSEDIVVMANDLLFELLNHLEHMALTLSLKTPVRIMLSVRKVRSPGVEGGTPQNAELTASVPGIRVPEGVKERMFRWESPADAKTPLDGFSNAVETANLIAFIFRGQVYFEDLEAGRPEAGSRLVVLLPLADVAVSRPGTPPDLDQLKLRSRK